VQALAALVTAEAATHLVFTHTYQTRDYTPKLAARLDRALVTDCIGLKNGGAGSAAPVFVRPMFQNKVKRTSCSKDPRRTWPRFRLAPSAPTR
jgi:electron transfer flavoprotein alpha subunit